MNQAAKPRNSAGRPAGGDSDKVRADLLQAARDLFLKREFKAVSIREIAQAAGVNGAMVNYYFGNKQGLYLAMVDDLLASLEDSLAALGEHGELTVADFSAIYCRLLAQNPWWPNFLAREVLFSEGEIRESVVEKFGQAFAPKIMQSIQQEIAAGNFRDDLDPRLTLVSLLGMTVFPFIARPMMEMALGLEVNEKLADQLAAHNTTLFLHGVETMKVETNKTDSTELYKQASEQSGE